MYPRPLRHRRWKENVMDKSGTLVDKQIRYS